MLAAWPAVLAVFFGSELLRAVPGGGRLVELPWAPSLHLSLSFNLDGLGLLFATLITGTGTGDDVLGPASQRRASKAHFTIVRRARHGCEMHSSAPHSDDVDIGFARLRRAECDIHCSHHVGRVIDPYEDDVPLFHSSSRILVGPLPLGGAFPFDATMGHGRDDQQRAVVLAKNTQCSGSKQLEASAASNDDEIGVHAGGVFENRASCGARRHLYACVDTRGNWRHDTFQSSERVFLDVCAVSGTFHRAGL